MKKMILLLAFLLLMTGCYHTETVQEPIQVVLDMSLDAHINGIIETKLEALSTDDIDLYMSTVTDSNTYYVNEQGRWFKEMTKDVIKNITMEAVSVETLDETSGVVTIRQTHETNQSFDFTYPLLFKLENGEWKDHGYHFNVLETDRFIVMYMDDEDRLEEFTEYLNHSYDVLEEIFIEKADANFELKLFTDQELLRQRTVPSISWLFTGWAEPDESLKLYTGHQGRGYQGTMQHELTHHITIKVCNNNLAPWLLEGIAMYYGNIHYEKYVVGETRPMAYDEVNKDIDYLESLDLYNAPGDEVRRWYNNSYMVVNYLVETYGHDELMALFYEAGKKPFNSSVFNENFDEDNITTTEEVLKTVLGLTKEELSVNYLEWLKTYYD